MWGYSSAGRALEWHSRGQRFDPAYLHHHNTRACGLIRKSLWLYNPHYSGYDGGIAVMSKFEGEETLSDFQYKILKADFDAGKSKEEILVDISDLATDSSIRDANPEEKHSDAGSELRIKYDALQEACADLAHD